MTNIDIRLLKKITTYLASSSLQIAVAESCTGGLLAAALTQLPGSSQWFDRGFVTYSNAAKQELLGVTERTLQHYGAVSAQTAKAMVKGVLKNSRAQVVVAITGIAGPQGDSKSKPVGTVWFAVADKSKTNISVLHQFTGSREIIRIKSVNFALNLLNQHFAKDNNG